MLQHIALKVLCSCAYSLPRPFIPHSLSALCSSPSPISYENVLLLLYICILSCILKIYDWFLANKLSLNLDKTNYILFKSHRKPSPKDNPGIKIQDLLLNQVESTRFLG